MLNTHTLNSRYLNYSPKANVISPNSVGIKPFAVGDNLLNRGFCKPVERIKSNCCICNKELQLTPYQYYRRTINHICSRECRILFCKSKTGIKNPNYRNSINKRPCKVCDKPVNSYIKTTKFCSMNCLSQYRLTTKEKRLKDKRQKQLNHKPKQREYKIIKYPQCTLHYYNCHICKNIFTSNSKQKRVCVLCKPISRRNSAIKAGLKQRQNIYKICPNCNMQFRVSESIKNRIHCSDKCYSRKGENNNKWRGGITPFNKKIRNSEEYKLWRKSVFERDRYTCVWCGQIGGNLHADHIKQFAYYPELRLDINNGRTLCKPCHQKTDTYLKGKK